ncbi:hypothetical protein MTO96_010118 [Rhipicephalus appendiculatus]
MEDIGHERDAGQLDDNKSPGQEDDESTNRWTYVTYKKKKAAERKESDTSKSNFSPPNPRKAGQMIAGRILNSSKMPRLPEGEVKVIIRPRDGLNIRATCSASLDETIYEAAGLTRDDRLTICPNLTQNIVVVSTPESATAERLRRIKEIQIQGKTHEVEIQNKIEIQEQTQGGDTRRNRPQEEVPLAREEPAAREHEPGRELHDNKGGRVRRRSRAGIGEVRNRENKYGR